MSTTTTLAWHIHTNTPPYTVPCSHDRRLFYAYKYGSPNSFASVISLRSSVAMYFRIAISHFLMLHPQPFGSIADPSTPCPVGIRDPRQGGQGTPRASRTNRQAGKLRGTDRCGQAREPATTGPLCCLLLQARRVAFYRMRNERRTLRTASSRITAPTTRSGPLTGRSGKLLEGAKKELKFSNFGGRDACSSGSK